MIRSPRPRSAARLLAPLALALAWTLAGCGPGEGGTGLPPTAAGSTTVSAPIDATQGAAPTLATLLGAGVRADAVGRIVAVDAQSVTVAGTVLPRSQLDLVLADGRPAPTAALVVGTQATAWRIGDRWLVLLEP